MSLRHADGKFVESEIGEFANLAFGFGKVDDAIGAIDFLRDRLDLLFDRGLDRIEMPEIRRLLASLHDGACGRFGTFSAVHPALERNRGEGPGRFGPMLNHFDLVVVVENEAVNRVHDRNAEFAHVLDVFFEVFNTFFEVLVMPVLQEIGQLFGIEAFDHLRRHAVHFQGAHRTGDHHATRFESACAAGDVHELFGTHVRGEP